LGSPISRWPFARKGRILHAAQPPEPRVSESTFSYDAVAYPSLPLPQTHPGRLAAIARLHGVPAASPTRCRLLEVGCGDGSNLFPLALAYPDSTFVGIDLSAAAIGRGRELLGRVGLPNLTLEAADLTKWEPGPEGFDFVVAHGFYSWVPPFVRDALLAVCRDRLRPAGLAYISYNALPGCHIRRMVWEMLRFHVREITDPEPRLQQAVAMLELLAHGAIGTGLYPELIRQEARKLAKDEDHAVLYHDDLSDINDPMMVTEFVAHAGRFGLQFLGESDYFEMTTDLLPTASANLLRGLAERDVVLKEQYFDFLKGRRFRQTILCRADASVRREPDPAAVFGLAAVGEAVPDPDPPDLTLGVPVKFRTAAGASMTTDHPVAKAALADLRAAFPAARPFPELLADAVRRAGRTGDANEAEDRNGLAKLLLGSYRVGLLELHLDPPRFARAAGARPKLSPLARVQLDTDAVALTSLRPSIVRMENPISRELLRLLDGTRDRAAILTDLADRAAGDPQFTPPNESPRSAAWWRDQLAPQIEPGLAMAAKTALLMDG
jgi:SAM-dependent methyltransferase